VTVGKGVERRAAGLPFASASSEKRLPSEFYVEGYATTFERYLLWDFDDFKYYEQISPNALDGADLSDVIMQYDHQGRVYARNRNGTLGIGADSKGVFIYADLSKSASSRGLYEEISAGLVDRMSWAFTVAKHSVEKLDGASRLVTIEKVKKVYDVSAVSIPANDGTEISARGFAEARLLAERQRQLRLRARLLGLKIKTGGFK